MDEARESLLMSAYWKIPLQALVLLVGVLMFVFYLFTPSPMLFNARARHGRCGRAAGGGVRGARAHVSSGGQRVDVGSAAGDWRAREAGRRRRSVEAATADVPAQRCRGAAVRSEALALVREVDRRCGVQRRELRLSDVHHRRTCRSAWSAC